MSDIKALQDRIDYHFLDEGLLKTALTHSSVNGKQSYERLEFLGDRVLGLIVSRWLYEKFPDEPEGDLAKRLSALVQGSFLCGLALKYNLGDFMEFSTAESAAGGADNEHILADVFEALLGAMYLDSGINEADRFVRSAIGDEIGQMSEPPQHPKTYLQEWAQGQGFALPEYEIIEKDGPDHAPNFIVRVSVKGVSDYAQGCGNSLARAQKEAASMFIKKYTVS